MLLFETQSLCKFYRAGTRDEVRALDDVTLRIERGSVLVVTGPSGSGKTTLLALLGALERPTRGAALFEGKNLAECSDVELARLRRRMGFVFQDFGLIPNLSAAENITYPLIPRGVPRAERLRRARELLSRFGIETKLPVRAQGQPEVILADEPSSNLDPATARVLLEVFRELHAAGTTMILSSHDPAVIALATRVCELEGGKLRPEQQQ